MPGPVAVAVALCDGCGVDLERLGSDQVSLRVPVVGDALLLPP